MRVLHPLLQLTRYTTLNLTQAHQHLSGSRLIIQLEAKTAPQQKAGHTLEPVDTLQPRQTQFKLKNRNPSTAQETSAPPRTPDRPPHLAFMGARAPAAL